MKTKWGDVIKKQHVVSSCENVWSQLHHWVTFSLGQIGPYLLIGITKVACHVWEQCGCGDRCEKNACAKSRELEDKIQEVWDYAKLPGQAYHLLI